MPWWIEEIQKGLWIRGDAEGGEEGGMRDGGWEVD